MAKLKELKVVQIEILFKINSQNSKKRKKKLDEKYENKKISVNEHVKYSNFSDFW